MNTILNKYAKLLVNYCVELQKGERLFIKSTTLAEPLVREVYKEALKAGGNVEVQLDFMEKDRIFYKYADEDQLEYFPLLEEIAMNEFDAYILIRAPFNLKETQNSDKKKQTTRQNALSSIKEAYFTRTANRDLKRNLCQYPTQANAQEAGMSLEEYSEFIFNACNLYDENPMEAWLKVRADQQKVTDYLNSCTEVRYITTDTDISFKTDGRLWMNSDGQTNMPSGEVYTSPLEDSVNGHIYFSYPAIYMGHEVEGVRLWVENGEIVKWDAESGKEFLDYIFSLEGTRRFGEAAIGTNYSIDKITKNILFDEKIGGSIHMAIGQSYLQCGGENKSSIHWDMITDMKKEGKIYADGKMIYEKGKFII